MKTLLHTNTVDVILTSLKELKKNYPQWNKLGVNGYDNVPPNIYIYRIFKYHGEYYYMIFDNYNNNGYVSTEQGFTKALMSAKELAFQYGDIS